MCKQGDDLRRFRSNIGERYAKYSETLVARLDPKIVVRIPPSIAAAVGRAKSVNKDGYTTVIVPVRGTWRGLSLTAIAFDFGIENGISRSTFRFAAPREAVARAFGKDTASAQKAFQPNADAGFSVSIPDGKAEIECDEST